MTHKNLYLAWINFHVDSDLWTIRLVSENLFKQNSCFELCLEYLNGAELDSKSLTPS